MVEELGEEEEYFEMRSEGRKASFQLQEELFRKTFRSKSSAQSDCLLAKLARWHPADRFCCLNGPPHKVRREPAHTIERRGRLYCMDV